MFGWFATSKVGRAFAAGGALALAIGVAVLKVFNAGKRSERLAGERDALRAKADALQSQKEIRDETRRMSDADLDRDNAPWLRK